MNLIEKSLKHFLKKKTKFTEALLVLFLITGGITYANTNIENKATGEGSIAIGKDSEANNISALALGTISQTRGFSAISLGTGAEANSDFSISAGLDSIANGKHSVTIGTESKTHSNSTVAIGPWSEAITSGSIALGEDSKAERYETFGYNPLSNSNIYSMNDIPNFKGNQNIREELILLETELNNKIQEAENLVKERGQAIINGDTNRSQTLLQQL